jgi:hypothetical protein
MIAAGVGDAKARAAQVTPIGVSDTSASRLATTWPNFSTQVPSPDWRASAVKKSGNQILIEAVPNGVMPMKAVAETCQEILQLGISLQSLARLALRS